MASDIWLRIILIVRKEIRCRHIWYSFRLAARVLLYAPSHRQDSTYHGLCYTSRGAPAGTRNSSMGPPHVACLNDNCGKRTQINIHVLCMCVCMYIYTYIHIHTQTHIYTQTHKHTQAHTHTYNPKHTLKHTHTYRYTQRHIHTYART